MASEAANGELLAAIALKANDCTACGLAETRRSVVFGEGNPDSPLVFVGEGPGDTEDQTGRPFVGRAGQLLDECMRATGITRKHAYICNILKCRACEIENGRARNRAPRPDEIDSCLPWLDQQLGIIRPIVLVCLGSPSANTIIHRNFRITQERGQWFTDCRYARYAMATLHPAFILRQDGPTFERLKQQLIEDIESARKKVIAARKEVPATLF